MAHAIAWTEPTEAGQRAYPDERTMPSRPTSLVICEREHANTHETEQQPPQRTSVNNKCKPRGDGHGQQKRSNDLLVSEVGALGADEGAVEAGHLAQHNHRGQDQHAHRQKRTQRRSQQEAKTDQTPCEPCRREQRCCQSRTPAFKTHSAVRGRSKQEKRRAR